MNVITGIGNGVLRRWATIRNVSSVAWAVINVAWRPRNWPRTVREQFARQVKFSGIDAVRLISLIGLLAGISVVAQAQLFVNRFGQSEMLGPILVAVVVREMAPLLVNLIVIGRSGTAIATELANMRVRREVDILDAQGVDPVSYLVVPRVLAMAVSVFCLTILFVAVSFGSGYIFGLLAGGSAADPFLFARNIFNHVYPADAADLLAKTLIPGLLTGIICSIEGLNAAGAVTEVPRAATRAVVKSIVSVILVFAVVSVLMYV